MIPFPRRRSQEIHHELDEETPALGMRDEWTELSLSDCQVVGVSAAPAPRRREPTDPGVSFARILTAEIDRALSAEPPSSQRPQRPMLTFVEVPMPRASTTPTLRKPRAAAEVTNGSWSRRSRIPLATAVLAFAIGGGLLADQVRAGHLDHAIAMLTSFVAR